MPRHYPVDLSDEEVVLIDHHCKTLLNPEELKKEPGWIPAKDGEDVNRVGVLSECAVNKWWGTSVELTLLNRPETKRRRWSKDDGFDIIMCGYKLDIKCQPSPYLPRSNWLWNVSEKVAISPNKECDGYLWVYKKTGKDHSYEIIGWMPRGEFLEKATFHLKGASKKFQNGEYTTNTYDIGEEYLMDVMDFKRSKI